MLLTKTNDAHRNELWEKWIGEPKFAPPCTMAVVVDLPVEKALIAITIIAVVSKNYDEAEEEKLTEDLKEAETSKEDAK